ncbi:MAG: sugar phosphate isomerase/epimerase [Clostridia bacterium]|nr:sugar phosphate isomerase/epimerase [Clostridia bacterium]
MNDTKGFRISAFADEYARDFDEQLKGMNELGIKYIEIRKCDGRGIEQHTEAETKVLAKKLSDRGIGLSAVGSPIGKIQITDDFDSHLELLKHVCEQAHILGTDRIRMFSFYLPKDGDRKENLKKYRSDVLEKMNAMIETAEREKLRLCCENELRLYGEQPEECLDIAETFGDRLGFVFDHANFILSGAEAYPRAFGMLKERITYMHIKDALGAGEIVPAGRGEGRIAETLSEIKNKEGFFLTIEPHLKVFDGLVSLSGENSGLVKNRYATSAEAFRAARDGLYSCIAAI